MNYDEWYKSMPGLGISEEAIASVTWKACKEEVLRMLSEKYSNECWWDEVKEDIEKI
jgi:hypothetical protein